MSIGLDFSFIFILLVQAIENLSGAAVKGFKERKAMLQQLRATAKLIRDCSKHADDPRLKEETGKIQGLLWKVSKKLNGLEKHLGEGRSRASLATAAKKIAWPLHDSHFSRDFEALMQQIHILHIKKTSLKDCAPDAPLQRNIFYLEDANGAIQSIDFAHVPNWDDLHKYLLQRFPRGSPMHRAIVQRRYLFHRDHHNDDILSQDPGIRPLQVMVDPSQRLRMTVIFPLQDVYEEKCPKCHAERSAEFPGPVLSCPGCDLKLRFRDSHDGEPDPITRSMLQNMSQNDRRALLKHFLTTLCPSTRWLGEASRTTPYSPALEDLIRSGARHAPAPGQQAPDSAARSIRHFTRVTLCTVQSPDISGHRQRDRAARELSQTVNQVQRRVEYLEADDLPIVKAAWALNSRFWNARYSASCCRFLKSVRKAHDDRRPAVSWPPATVDYLNGWHTTLGDSKTEFLLPALLFRCLFWIYGELLDVEAEIMRGCTRLLRGWALPRNMQPRTCPLAFKLFCIPHTVIFLPIAVTGDVLEDVVEYAQGKTIPLYLARAVEILVQRSDAVALDHYLENILDRFWDQYVLLEQPERTRTAACKRWLETAMAAGTLERELPGAAEDLEDMMHRGCL